MVTDLGTGSLKVIPSLFPNLGADIYPSTDGLNATFDHIHANATAANICD